MSQKSDSDLDRLELEAVISIAKIHARFPYWAIGLGTALVVCGVFVPQLSDRKTDLLGDASKVLLGAGLGITGVGGVGFLRTNRRGANQRFEDVDQVNVINPPTNPEPLKTPLNLPRYPDDPEIIKYRQPLEPKQNSFKGYPGE